MILLALALQAAASQTAVEAERAFDQAAQRKGQWTAFRKFATKDAVMFVPEQVNAQAWLKGRSDPPRPVRWQPTASYLSCNGKVAVNTGAWQRPDGSVGYFTTLWMRQPDGSWKWTMDHGDRLAKARPAASPAKVRSAACKAPEIAFDTCRGRWERCRAEQSEDRSLSWHWRVEPNGARHFDARIWNGRTFETVIDDNVARPK